jgi:hypothetical protein
MLRLSMGLQLTEGVDLRSVAPFSKDEAAAPFVNHVARVFAGGLFSRTAIMNPEFPKMPGRGRIIGMGSLARALFEGKVLEPVWNALHARIDADPTDVDAIFDASLILRLTGRAEVAQTYLQAALQQQACYTVRHGLGDRLTLLVLQAGADVMANAPIDLVLEGSDLTVHYLHLDGASVTDLPPHDIAFLAVGEAVAHQPILAQIDGLLAHWPVPLMNGDARRIAAMTRDQVSAALADVPEILCPRNALVDRTALMAALEGSADPLSAGFPYTIRPVGTDCGKGLERIEDRDQLQSYLDRYVDDGFFLAPFIDYRGPDGEFRKHRIAFIDGRPYPAHLAISPNWIVHYLSAGMSESAAKRAEEAGWMDEFDTDFAVRHGAALAAIHARIGTDYFSIDCSEAPDGRLLFFEADVASIIHALDPVDTFSYKRPHMLRLFEAFITALESRVSCVAERSAAA